MGGMGLVMGWEGLRNSVPGHWRGSKMRLSEGEMAFVAGCGWNARRVRVKLRLEECEIGEVWSDILGDRG